jgi:hypothetical protein
MGYDSPGMESQLSLFRDEPPAAAHAVEPLADAFRRLAPDVSFRLVYAAARRRIFSWTDGPGPKAVTLRLAPEFRDAPIHVAEALVRVVTTRRLPREARRRLFFEVRSWAAVQGASCGGPPGRSLPPAGRHVDLAPVLARVQQTCFPEPVPARIGWSEHPARRLMGRFEKGSPQGLVVVNRLLDGPLTPHWYLDFLVYHELLHAVFPPRPGATRILVHPPEFRRAERRHPDHRRARTFEEWACGRGFKSMLDPLRSGARLPPRFR